MQHVNAYVWKLMQLCFLRADDMHAEYRVGLAYGKRCAEQEG